MATSSNHPTFPSRPYTTGLSRAGASTSAQQNTFNTPAGFGSAATTTQQHREAQRIERERADRAERERVERAGQNQLAELSEEQREEINEAVRAPYPTIPPANLARLPGNLDSNPNSPSLPSSTSTKMATSTTTSSKSP